MTFVLHRKPTTWREGNRGLRWRNSVVLISLHSNVAPLSGPTSHAKVPHGWIGMPVKGEKVLSVHLESSAGTVTGFMFSRAVVSVGSQPAGSYQ